MWFGLGKGTREKEENNNFKKERKGKEKIGKKSGDTFHQFTLDKEESEPLE